MNKPAGYIPGRLQALAGTNPPRHLIRRYGM